VSVAEFDLDSLLAKLEKILKSKKNKPDAATVELCGVIASLVVEVARLRARDASGSSGIKETP
jgi:hypothetical protein